MRGADGQHDEVLGCTSRVRFWRPPDVVAKPVSKELNVAVTTAPWLACGAKPEVILEELAALENVPAVMLVGHEPDLGNLIAHLLGAASGSIHVRKASLTLVEVLLPRKGGGRLEFSVPVRLME